MGVFFLNITCHTLIPRFFLDTPTKYESADFEMTSVEVFISTNDCNSLSAPTFSAVDKDLRSILRALKEEDLEMNLLAMLWTTYTRVPVPQEPTLLKSTVPMDIVKKNGNVLPWCFEMAKSIGAVRELA